MMLNKKIIIIFGVLFLMSMAFVTATNVLSNSAGVRNINSLFRDCVKNCSFEKRQSFAECKADFKQNYTILKENYKACLFNAKNSSNRTEYRALKKECRRIYREGKKIIRKIAFDCRKQAIEEHKQCQAECIRNKSYCFDIANPVCGRDGQTYLNRCYLRKAGVRKACDGECPCDNQNNPRSCFSNEDCNRNRFCEFDICLAETGTCVNSLKNCPTVYDPVCGCDEKTYSNDCVRRSEKVSKKHDGPCLDSENHCQAEWIGYIYDPELEECKEVSSTGCANPFEYLTKEECEEPPGVG